MAVGVVMDFDGATIEQYDEILKLMNLKAGGPAPSGCLFHWVTKTDKGMRVTDVWQTKEQFEKFAQEQIGPFSAQVGITAQPKIAFDDVHSYMTAGK